MRGWLIVNHFLMSTQFTTLYDRFLESASAAGVDLVLKTNVEVACELAVPGGGSGGAAPPNFVLFWDKDVRLCEQLEQLGVRTFNSARAIEVCDDKTLTYRVLAAGGRVPQPESLLVPKAFGPEDWDATPFPDAAVRALGLPLVAKEAFGSFGEQVRLARSREDVVWFLDETSGSPGLLQRFLAVHAGSDARLQVVGDSLVAAMKRTSRDGDFRANVVNGGEASPYEPDDGEVAVALAACKAIGLDFAGVDLLWDDDGRPCVCEVNSNAHFATLERLTGADVASAIMLHIARAVES